MLPRSYKSTMRSCRKQNKERYESMQPYMIETVDITKRFPGTLANDHICLRARAGEIMGLVGENGAGKSTILKCLNGVYPSDSYEGKILIEGKEVQLNSPLDAIRLGIGFVPQEINVLQDMNVAENIFLFDLRNGGQEKLVNHKQLRLRTKQLLEKTGIDLDPSANVRRLSIGQQQMLMIARALATDPKILILDEPTTSLSGQDVQSLFKVMRVLKEKGVAIIFVTHKLAEIMEMTDCLTVMRDGKNVGSYTRDEYDQNKIVEDMIGRKLTVMYPERACSIGEELLRVEHLDVEHPYIADRYLVQDFNLTVRAGEVVGLAGLVGAGRSEAVMGIYGELKRSHGTIYVAGQKVQIHNPRDAIRHGIGMVTEDRKKYGLHFTWSIRKNIALSNLRAIAPHGFIQLKTEQASVQKYYDAMGVKANSMNDLVESLSGGNQQYPERACSIGEELLRVEHLDVEHPYIADRYLVQDFNLTVRAGEVVGLAGLVGAGRSEAVMGIYGELKRSHGTIYVAGQKVQIHNPRDAIRHGIGMVTEDRKKYGLHFTWSIRKNIALSNLRAIAPHGFIQLKTEQASVQKYYDAMGVKANSMNDLVESLSGGNQQKVVIGRTLNAEPRIVILDEPTKGIDVGAKAEIYNLINQLAERGVAVVLISSELPELMAMSDRFLVMAEGRVAGELSKEEATEAKIMNLATTTYKTF